MKLLQQLLVTPAALGLLLPIAATGAELNISSSSNSEASTNQIKNFSDIHPSDWTYQALTSLHKRHDCGIAGPTGSMTRYEAAALLNKSINQLSHKLSEQVNRNCSD